MNKKYILSLTVILILAAVAYLQIPQNNRYTFQHLGGEGLGTVLIGDTRTGMSWICLDTATYNKMKDTQTIRKDIQDNFNGCISFTKP